MSKKIIEKNILVIIPAYNEEKNIVNTIHKLQNQTIPGIHIDYIIINDGSTDNTEMVLQDNHFNHIQLPCNLGIGGAVQTGYKYALKYNYDIAIQFDGDGQHDPSYIKDIITPIIEEDYDFVIGSRFVGNESEFKSTRLRRLGSRILSCQIKLFTGKKIKDVTSGFRAANKQIIKTFANDYPSDYPEPETIMILLKRHKKVKEVPVRMHERENGTSSIKAFKSFYYMLRVSIAIFILGIGRVEGDKDE